MISKEYFSHDYNTRNKKKLGAIIHDHKMSGYGLFWVIVEMLHEDTEKWMSLDQVTFNSIAKESMCDVEFVKIFIDQCLKIYEVFIEKDGKFTTERVLKNTQIRLDIKEKRSKAGKISASVKQVINKCSTKTNKGKESKVKERIHIPNGISEPAVPAIPPDPEKDLKKEFEEMQLPESAKEAWVVCKEWVQTKKPVFIEPYVAAWNIFSSFYQLPVVKKITEARRRKFRTRVREDAFDFFEILNKCKHSEFLKSSGWFCFDWVIENESNYIKILEENYK